MPTYSYKCPACGHSFDKLVKMADSQKTQECPECKKDAERQVSAPSAFQFKGGGYYVTDFR